MGSDVGVLLLFLNLQAALQQQKLAGSASAPRVMLRVNTAISYASLSAH